MTKKGIKIVYSYNELYIQNNLVSSNNLILVWNEKNKFSLHKILPVACKIFIGEYTKIIFEIMMNEKKIFVTQTVMIYFKGIININI